MISTVILYNNEKEALNRVLQSLNWCDDIVVLADESSKYIDPCIDNQSVTIIKRALNNDFGSQRNFAMTKTKHNWILFIDPDEKLSSELCDELQSISFEDNFDAYSIRRVDIFWDKQIWHGELSSASHKGIIRLVHRHNGQWKGRVHEVFVPEGTIGSLCGVMYHYPHQTIGDFIHDINRYSSIRAKEISRRPTSRLFIELLFFPPCKFVYTYFIKLGFLDGTAGYTYSFMMAFHSFLVRAKAITKT